MPAIQPAQFDQGDNPLGQKFLSNLQIVASQAADGCSIQSASLLTNYVPGVGTTIELPALSIPPIPKLVAFPAKITSTLGAACAWTALEPATASTWGDATGGSPLSGTTGTDPAYEINGREGFPANYRVLMWQERADDGAFAYWFVAPNSLFPVKVEKTGGSNGTVSSAPSYTYTVRTLSGTTLGTSIAVSRPASYGAVTFQSGSSGYGVAFYDGSTLKLWDAGEIPEINGCTTS